MDRLAAINVLRDFSRKALQKDGIAVLKLERAAIRSIHAALSMQRLAVVLAIHNGQEVKSADFDFFAHAASFLDAPISDLTDQALMLGATSAVTDLGLLSQLVSSLRERVTRHYRDFAAARVRGINETTRRMLRSIIVQQTAAGATKDQIAIAIMDEGNDSGIFSLWRAELIAQQEAAEAHGTANYDFHVEYGKTLGIKQVKWIVDTGDERECDSCAAAASEGEIPIDSRFGGASLFAPLHVRCRCETHYGTA